MWECDRGACLSHTGRRVVVGSGRVSVGGAWVCSLGRRSAFCDNGRARKSMPDQTRAVVAGGDFGCGLDGAGTLVCVVGSGESSEVSEVRLPAYENLRGLRADESSVCGVRERSFLCWNLHTGRAREEGRSRMSLSEPQTFNRTRVCFDRVCLDREKGVWSTREIVEGVDGYFIASLASSILTALLWFTLRSSVRGKRSDALLK